MSMALQGTNSADELQDTAHIWHVPKVPNTAVRLVSHKNTPAAEVVYRRKPSKSTQMENRYPGTSSHRQAALI